MFCKSSDRDFNSPSSLILDGRLRMILEQLGVSKFFAHVFVSSEIGADQTRSEIFRRALKFVSLETHQSLHAGDDQSVIGKQRRPRDYRFSAGPTEKLPARSARDPVAAVYLSRRSLAEADDRR